MKKVLGILLATAIAVTVFAGCSKQDGKKDSGALGDITVISREEGSGTRGAFIELFGIEKKDDSGKKIDYTIDSAEQTNSTAVMMTSVSQNKNAIGYVSLGSLNDSVKVLKIDGAEATVENIKNGTYKISRPFNIITKETVNELANDFIAYILSKEGQAVVEKNGYIPSDNAEAYNGSKPSGKIVISGSSSVTPVMEKLKEAYLAVNTNAQIDIQQNDSTTGVTHTIDGICDIGMISRELKDSETSKGIKAKQIAIDGIAVIINKENTTDNMTKDQVMNIYTGKVTKWSEIMAAK